MGWARAGRFGASGGWIPKIPLKLVRSVEITANFHRCKKYFEKIREEGMARQPPVYFGIGCSAAESKDYGEKSKMVRQLTSENYEEFVRGKRAAAVHFDAEWDLGYRPITRQKMQEAEQALAAEVNFGEIDVDRDIPLAKSVGILGVPAVAYYLDGQLVALLLGIRQDIRGRLERVLRGEPIGDNDGMDGR